MIANLRFAVAWEPRGVVLSLRQRIVGVETYVFFALRNGDEAYMARNSDPTIDRVTSFYRNYLIVLT